MRDRVSGKYPWDIEDMHMMYGKNLRDLDVESVLTDSIGSVVRIAPNELTFASVQSFNG